MSIAEQRGTAYFARMRSLCMLLTIGLLASCSVGNDFSRTTFQKKRYSRGYYVHKAKDRSVPNSPDDPAAATSESQDKPASSTMEVVPPGVAGNAEPTPIQSSRSEWAQPRPVSLPIPVREMAGMAHNERSLLLPEPQDNEEKSERKPVHWTTIANLITLMGGMVGSLFNSPWVQIGLAAPLFAAISFAFAGPRRRNSGMGAAILTFLLFFITLIVVESQPDSGGGVATVLAALTLLVCWLAYAVANRFFAPDRVAGPEAFHGVDMEADPEPHVKRPLHWSIWVASGAFVLGLIPSLHVLLFTAWIPAYLGIVASGPNKEHSGLALATVLFIASLLLGLLALGVIAVFLRYVFGG